MKVDLGRAVKESWNLPTILDREIRLCECGGGGGGATPLVPEKSACNFIVIRFCFESAVSNIFVKYFAVFFDKNMSNIPKKVITTKYAEVTEL